MQFDVYVYVVVAVIAFFCVNATVCCCVLRRLIVPKFYAYIYVRICLRFGDCPFQNKIVLTVGAIPVCMFVYMIKEVDNIKN